jgi:acetyl esterase
MLYLHGGGWALGDLDINDDVCRFLAHHAGIVVLSLEYSLAPEHPFPTSLDEATTVATLIAAGALDAPSTLLLGGLSAGGSLAAAVAARGVTGTAPRAQSLTLLSPVTDSDVDRPSMLDYATAPVLTRTDMQWFWSMYDPHGIHRADPDAAPIRAESFHGLPPTTVVVAGVDPLRDEGIAYADALREADVDVALEVVEGVPHGFMAVPSIRSGRRSLTRCAERISEAIAGSIG